jgi:hypothetical protein
MVVGAALAERVPAIETDPSPVFELDGHDVAAHVSHLLR